jgi:hypothetical protein
MAQQRKAFEAERKKRLEKEKAVAAEGKAGPGVPPPQGSLPPGVKRPSDYAPPQPAKNSPPAPR